MKDIGTMSGLNGINEEAFNYYPWNRLLQYVDEHYSEHISLAKAARLTGLGISSFAAFFRKSVGINFADWLREVRVEKAIELMKARDFSIPEIAYEVGFGDLRTFGRAFKKHTLKTPMEFKKSVRPK